MERDNKEIIWTEPAINDLKGIYFFIAEKSISAANKLLDKLIIKPEIIAQTGFSNVGQIDDINPNYRHLIEGNYKILYQCRLVKQKYPSTSLRVTVIVSVVEL